MAKQTYTIKFGIDANDFIRELTALQSQLQNIASSMDVGLSADRVKEFSSGLNTILKNYTTAISKQDFSAMQSSLDGVYEEAIKIQKALGSDIKIDGLLSSLGRAKSTLGEFRDMTTTVSGAAISAAENIASAQQRAANQSKEASQVATVSLEQQKQKLAELQSMQQMLAGYANKRGNADKNKIKTSLVTDDLEINDSNEMHLYDVADRIKETYADLAKEMSSIDWSKAAGDPEQLQKTLSLLQQCSEMYRLIHSSDTQDILESAKFNGDQLDGSPIKTLEQAFASENEMSQKAAESLKEFSSAFEGVVDQFTKKFSTIYQSIQAQAEAQADVVKSIESGVTATNMQVQADTNAAEAAERKAQAQREAAAALSSMAGTKRVVDSNDDVINLANARQHTIKIKLSVGNPKEFLSQMQSAMADAQQIANVGIKVKAEISNDMISTVTKKYSKSGSTEQEIAINIVAKEKDNQSKVVSGVRSRLQEEAEKNPVRIPIKVEFKDAAGSIDEVKKKAEAELQKEADSIIPTTGAKATIKHKLASAEATDAVAQAKASVKNAQQMMSETLASLDAQTEKPITFAVKFNPDLAAVQQQFNDAIAAVRATAAEPVAIGTKIDDTIASLQGDASSATPIKIPVVPDAEMFKSGIATLIESASTVTPIKIPVAPDVEALLSKLSEVKASNTEVAVGFDATTATANFEALINSLAEKSNVAIKTTLDSDEMYNNFNAVVKKMRDRMSAHPIKVHIELAKSDLDNLSADDAWQNHLQSMTQLAKAEGDALDSVLGKAKELQADIEASAKQLPSLIKLLQTYQKTGGNNKQAGTANRAKSSERSAIRSTEKYTNESARVLNNIAQYENYNSPDMQAQVTAIASLNKELIQARDNLFAITRDKKSSPDDVTRAFDKFNVTLADTRGRLRDASNEAAGLNREFVATRNDAQKKISDVKSSIAQMDKYVQNLPEQKIQKFYKDYQDYTKNIRAESDKFLSTASNPSSVRSSIQSQYDDFIKYYRTIWRGVQSMSADKSYNMANADKAFTKGSVFADNVASSDAFQAQVQQRLKSYKEFNGDFVNNGTQWIGTYRDASGAVKNLTLAMDQSKQVAREYSSDIKQPTSAMQQMGAVAQRAANYLVSSLATLVSFRMVIDYVRTGIGYVQQLDSALAQLQVVTGRSAGALKDAEVQARSIGDAIGSTTTEILNSATDWARLGYSMSDSLTLAEKSAELAKTGFMSVSTATEQMTASIQAFYGAQIGKGLVSVGDAAEHVNDELVAIGNNMPITSEGLGAALERSAGSLVAAGNSLEQSVALISAANSTIQNPESVGTALKTVSMRLRGTKVSDISNEVGEDVSDDFKNAAQDASKLYNTIKKLTAVKANDFKGVSILTDTGAYKSTYSIIKEIASAWDQMSNVNQAALLEQIAGKSLPVRIEMCA